MTNEAEDIEPRERTQRLGNIVRDELTDVVRRHHLGLLAALPIPVGAMGRTRSMVLRACGWNVGRGAVMAQTPRLIGSGPLLERLHIGAEVFVNLGNVWELSDRVYIDDRVAIGQDVMLLTSSHRIGSSVRRADELFTAPVTVDSGVWIGARSLVLPGVHIGEGALVAANTVVREDVPANVLFAGNPGRVIRPLDNN